MAVKHLSSPDGTEFETKASEYSKVVKKLDSKGDYGKEATIELLPVTEDNWGNGQLVIKNAQSAYTRNDLHQPLTEQTASITLATGADNIGTVGSGSATGGWYSSADGVDGSMIRMNAASGIIDIGSIHGYPAFLYYNTNTNNGKYVVLTTDPKSFIYNYYHLDGTGTSFTINGRGFDPVLTYESLKDDKIQKSLSPVSVASSPTYPSYIPGNE